MKTHALTACPGCESRAATEFGFGPDVRLRRCIGCGLVHAGAFADPSEIYGDGYLTGDKGDFGIDVSHPLFQEFLAYAAGRRLDLIERVQRPPARLLDVGCGSGEVLAVARDRGWEVAGAEPVEESAALARQRGLDVRAAMVQEAGLAERSYDVVSAFHVLEHIPTGTEFLRTAARWVRPGGHLVVEVPNWRSVHRRAYGAQWPQLRPLEHVAHYSPHTLAATLRRAGLEPVQVHTPGFLWEKQSLAHMLNDVAGSRWQGWRGVMRLLGRPGDHKGKPATVATGAGFATLQAVQAAYARMKIGMVVLAIARVP